MSRRRLLSLHDMGSFSVFGDMFDETGLYRAQMALGPGDTLVLEGGQDIHPAHYGEEILKGITQTPSPGRDLAEKMMIHHGKMAGASFIGICRGAQFLTAVAGGRLIQDVTGHIGEHSITISATGERITTSSVHHQMMFPYQLSDEDYELIAYSTDNLSDWYIIDSGEGKPADISAGLARSEFREPEIVWYPKFRALAIQGHPEFMSKRCAFVQYTRNLVKERILNATAN